MSKCYTMEARQFEKMLEDLGITFNQCHFILKKWEKLSLEAKAEVRDMLKTYEEEIER